MSGAPGLSSVEERAVRNSILSLDDDLRGASRMAELASGRAHDAACALPLYIRDKVAQTTEERAADRARKEMRRGASAAESR